MENNSIFRLDLNPKQNAIFHRTAEILMAYSKSTQLTIFGLRRLTFHWPRGMRYTVFIKLCFVGLHSIVDIAISYSSSTILFSCNRWPYYALDLINVNVRLLLY